ncbi:unnamed protein product [Heterobilharzia americana]|nr:unnamed protein product [Heterobilharzia americana]
MHINGHHSYAQRFNGDNCNHQHMQLSVYMRLTKADNKCYLCICIQSMSVPLNILGVWKKVGEADCLHEANPGDRMIILLESDFLCLNNNFSKPKLHFIDIPEDDQSIAKTVKCHMIKTVALERPITGKIVFKKYLSNSYCQTVTEVKIDTKFTDSSLKKDRLWTVGSLYDLASLYGYFKSSFKWHYFAELLGFTSQEIDEIDQSLLKDEYFVTGCSEAQLSPITPRRIFWLLLSNYQKLGGSLSQVANILLSASQRDKKTDGTALIHRRCLENFGENSNICNDKKQNKQLDFSLFSVLKKDIFSNAYNHVEFLNTPKNRLHPNQSRRSFNQAKRKIFRNGSLDRMMNCKQSWLRHERRRNSLPTTSPSDFFSHSSALSAFKLATDFDNFVEFGTPIKRASSYLHSEQEIPENTPNKRQRTETNTQQVNERIRRPKILTRRRTSRLIRQPKGNQTLLPNLWHPPTSSPSKKTTEHILNAVHAKIEETRRETEEIQKNVKSFLETLQSPVKKASDFVQFHPEVKENNSLFPFSDKIVQNDDIWNMIHLCDNSIAPNWKSWLKICHPTYDESSQSDRIWSKILKFSEIDERLTSYLLLLNWIETNSNPALEVKPTFVNLFQRLICSGYCEYVEVCKQNLFSKIPLKRSSIY